MNVEGVGRQNLSSILLCFKQCVFPVSCELWLENPTLIATSRSACTEIYKTWLSPLCGQVSFLFSFLFFFAVGFIQLCGWQASIWHWPAQPQALDDDSSLLHSTQQSFPFKTVYCQLVHMMAMWHEQQMLEVLVTLSNWLYDLAI